MRLRQLSRKLDIDTEKVIHYLKAINLPCEDDSNAKLSDEQVDVLIKKFGPINEVTQEEIETVLEPIAEIQEVVVEEEIIPIVENEVVEETENIEVQLSEVISILQKNQAEPTTEPEVIRAPKVELTGLKVVGKIELRVPKKKEETEEEAATTTEEKTNQPKVGRVKSVNDRHKQKNQPRNNTLSIADQRKREEKIKLRRKKEAEQQAKEKRKDNYLKKVKSKDKGETKKVIVEKINKTVQPKSKENVGMFTKFINWMRRE